MFVAAAFGLTAACTSSSLTKPPQTEFIVATADSTFWVTVDSAGIRFRGVPLVLAQYGGRFHEVYTSELLHSFDLAEFRTERIYRRDIETDDSTLVFEDSAVTRLARQYLKAHPDVRPFSGEDETRQPDLVVSGETDVLDVRGPYAVIEHRLFVDYASGDSKSDTVRTAVDLRNARRVGVADVLSDSVSHDAATFTDSGTTSWNRSVYSVVAHYDAQEGVTSFVLRDTKRHSWPLGVARTFSPRVYWLDRGAVDARTRKVLRRAFNDAAAYDENVQFAMLRPRPHARRAGRIL
jgi:hypothetical protein